MPVLKWERLRDFVKFLKQMGFKEISIQDLHYWIGREFGIGERTRARIHKALQEYKFIKPANQQFTKWKLCTNEEGGVFEDNEVMGESY